MTNPTTISDEARRLAQTATENGLGYVHCSVLERFAQEAINTATEKLTEENRKLKQACRNIFCPWCQTVYDKGDDAYKAVNEHLNKCLQHPISQRDSLQKQVHGLREEVEKAFREGVALARGNNYDNQDELWLQSNARKVVEKI